MMSERTLILHDFFVVLSGGEKVAMALAKSFHSELWTGQLDKRAFVHKYFDDLVPKSLEAYETSPRLFCFSKILQLWWAFAHFPAASTSWTIFSGSFSPLAHKKITGNKIYYCHTPPRLLYDQKWFILQQVPGWQRPLLKVVMSLYRLAYERAIGGMDIIIANSETVRERTMRYLGHDSSVVYPPCETERFQWIEEGNYFLSTARVDPLKRVDLIVRAFKEMPDKRLVVVSGGSDMAKIKRVTEKTENIDVLGWVDDKKLCDLMGRCIATIYIPRDEDFGISPVESMAAGKPVIGVREGGLLETVGEDRDQWSVDSGQWPESGNPDGLRAKGGGRRKGKNGKRWMDRMIPAGLDEDGQESAGVGKGFLVTDCGVLVAKDPGVGDVIEAVKWMTPKRALGMRRACEVRARRFDTDVFLQKMKDVIGGEV